MLSIRGGSYEVSDAGLKIVAARCPKLSAITLYWNLQVQGRGGGARKE